MNKKRNLRKCKLQSASTQVLVGSYWDKKFRCPRVLCVRTYITNVHNWHWWHDCRLVFQGYKCHSTSNYDCAIHLPCIQVLSKISFQPTKWLYPRTRISNCKVPKLWIKKKWNKNKTAQTCFLLQKRVFYSVFCMCVCFIWLHTTLCPFSLLPAPLPPFFFFIFCDIKIIIKKKKKKQKKSANRGSHHHHHTSSSFMIDNTYTCWNAANICKILSFVTVILYILQTINNTINIWGWHLNSFCEIWAWLAFGLYTITKHSLYCLFVARIQASYVYLFCFFFWIFFFFNFINLLFFLFFVFFFFCAVKP